MKTQSAQTASLFRDRPLSETPCEARRGSLLYATCFDRADYAESTLRVFLALCLLISLAVCSREWTASVAPVSKTVVQHVGTPGALVCSTPRSCRDVL